MLKGTYEQSVDAKGRMAFPAKLREQMGERLVLTRGTDGCIFVYTEQAFDDLANRLNGLKMAERIPLQRAFIASAIDAETDKQGRILIPARLRSVAGIEGEAVVCGVDDHCEIWEPGRWESLNSGFTDDVLMEALKGAEF
ncbi:MAG: division/cell wall cluster transcriptional repressor MraZ [Ruminococcus sp.]|nr:division/cell wall cluster transcriptional repressor MraZ [Ruminococcus sp.]